jgi:hypothetical protein
MKNKLTLAVVTALLTVGLSAAAHADTITFTLTDPDQSISAQAGGTLTYEVTASAPGSNGAAVFLNGDSGNVGGLSIDDSDFFANAPFFLDPGQSATFDEFTVGVPPGTPVGVYSGFFEVLGGATGGSGDELSTVDFVTNVTPEPGSFVLLGSGLMGLVGIVRRKRSI